MRCGRTSGVRARACGVVGMAYANPLSSLDFSKRSIFAKPLIQLDFLGRYRCNNALGEPDLRPAAGLGLQRPLRLHLLPSAVRVQPVRRPGALRPAAWQRPQRRRLARVLEPVIARYRERGLDALLPRRRGVRQARAVRAAGGRGHRLRHPPAGQPGPAGADRPPADAAGRPAAERSRRCSSPASATRRRAGPGRAGWWPRSSGTRASSTRASASSSPT